MELVAHSSSPFRSALLFTFQSTALTREWVGGSTHGRRQSRGARMRHSTLQKPLTNRKNPCK